MELQWTWKQSGKVIPEKDTLHIKLFTFSSSGNTLYLSRGLAEGLASFAHVSLFKMEETESPVIEENEVLCLCFPVFAWHLPLTVSRFIDNLPQCNQSMPVLLFITFGGIKGNVLFWAKKRLARKGYNVIWHRGMRCEDNHPVLRRSWTESFIIHGVPSEKDRNNVIAMAEDAFNHIGKPQKQSICFNPFYLILEPLWLLYHLTRGFWMRKYVIKDKCTRCGLCVTYCPAKVIKWGNDGYPEAPPLCDDCYRCVNICPVDAFQARGTRHGRRYRRMIGEVKENK